MITKMKVAMCLFLILATGAIASAQIQVRGKSPFSNQAATDYVMDVQSARNSLTGETLIVWISFPLVGTGWGPSQIWGRIIDKNGKPVTNQFPLVNGNAVQPSPTYNPDLNEYVVAYNTGDPGQSRGATLYIIRIDAKGHPLAPPIDLTSKDPCVKYFSNISGKILFNPITKGYTVIWFAHGNPNDLCPAGSTFAYNALKPSGFNGSFCGAFLLTAKGAKTTPLLSLFHHGKDPGFVGVINDIAYLPSAKKIIVISWAENLGEQRFYYLYTLDPQLKGTADSNVATAVQINSTPLLNGTPFWSRIAFTPDGAAYVYYMNTNSVIEGRKIDANGKLTGSSFVAFHSPKESAILSWPSAAFIKSTKGVRGILVASEVADLAHSASTWAQELDVNGQPKGEPTLIDQTSGTETVYGGLTIALPGTIKSSGNSRFTWFGTLSNIPTYGVFVANRVLKINMED